MLVAVDGLVVNKTTGKPQPDVEVALIQAGQGGMQRVGETKSDAAGRFTIANRQGPAGGVSMLQAKYKDVTYNRLLESASTGLSIEVFDTTADTSKAKVTQHFMVLEHVPGELRVNENIVLTNETQQTIANPKGTVRFYLPEAGEATVKISASSGRQGMPLNRTAIKTGEPHVFAADFPVKPGETLFNITWTQKFATPSEFSGRVLHKEDRMNLIVPRGMSLKGDKLQSMGTEPRTQASIYAVAFGPFTATVEGAGTIRNQTAPADESEEGGGTPVDVIPPKIYDRVYWVLGLAFGILGIAFYQLYRRPSA
jgi:5-hydroxyisourate hydrolase-like protein (transthyretin family)